MKPRIVKRYKNGIERAITNPKLYTTLWTRRKEKEKEKEKKMLSLRETKTNGFDYNCECLFFFFIYFGLDF